MKRFSALLFIFAAFAVSVFAQNSSSEKIEQLKLDNNIPVYYIKNTTNKIDSISISVEGGISYLTEETSGLEGALFYLMTYGSKKYNNAFLLNYNYETGSSVYYSSSVKESSLSLVCIDNYLDSGLEILADCFINPDFAKSDYDKMMNMYKNQIQQTMNDPSSLLSYYVTKVITRGSSYAVRSSVTPDSIQNITMENIKNLHKQTLDSRRIVIFASTSKESSVLLDDLNKTIGKIPAQKTELKKFVPTPLNYENEPIICSHETAQGTSFIVHAVKDTDLYQEDYYASKIAQSIYNDILYAIIRAKYGACYTPYCYSTGGKENTLVEVLINATSYDDIQNYMKEARTLAKSGQYVKSTDKDGKQTFGDISEILENKKNSLINSTFESQLTTAGKTGRMLNGYFDFNDPCAYDNIVPEIRKVTKEQVLEYMNKYFVDEGGTWGGITGPDDEERLEKALAPQK